MEYILADNKSDDAYWFKRGLPTLALALKAVPDYPEARFVLEYKKDEISKGILPTGRSWPIEKPGEEEV